MTILASNEEAMMGDYVIVTDSTTDLPAQLADELGLIVLPLSVIVGNDSYYNYLDGRELPIPIFYQRLVAGEPVSTSQISGGDYLNCFSALLEQGKDILYLALSSGLSASYSGSLAVREQLLEKYPAAKIHCVDTLCVSLGQGLLAWLAAGRKKEGYSLEQLLAWVEQQKHQICHWFTVDDLMHLYHHGRCSGAAAFAGSLLQIKPVLHVDEQGRLVPMEKVRSSKKALAMLVEKMAATATEPNQQTIFISHADNLEGAQYVESLILARWPEAKVIISYIGPVVGAHTSRGAVSLFFVGGPR